MASPFHAFRKHQKILIATLGLMAMIAFVFLPLFLKSKGSGGRKDPVQVSTTKYGNLTRTEVDRMRGSRQRLFLFLQAAIAAAAEGDKDFMSNQMYYGVNPLGLNNPSSQAAVREWLLVRHATELGMAVTDRQIAQFLHQLTDNRLTNSQFSQLYKQAHVTETMVFSSLHNAILAGNLRNVFAFSLAGTTPGQRWDYYQRFYRKVDLEVAPVDVAKFVDKKEDPGDKKLEEFFNEYKDQFTVAELPDPGFKIPHKVNVEYVKAKFSSFANPETVTDKEIEAFYNKNRDLYRNINLPSLDFDESWQKTEAELKAEETKAEEGPKQAVSVEPTVEKAAAPDAEKSTESAETSAVQEKAAPIKDAAPAVESSKESSAQPDSKPAGQPSETPDSKGARATVTTPFRFVSMQQETPQANDEAKPADPKSTPQPAEAEKPVEVKAAEGEPASTSSDKPAKPETPRATKLPSIPADETDSAKATSPEVDEAVPTTEAKPPTAEATAKPDYKPLQKVKASIRRTLAQQKAAERMKTALSKIQSRMRRHQKNLILYEATEDAKKETAPELDLEPLTKTTGLSFVRTGLLTSYEMLETDIGRSGVGENELFLRKVFGTMPMYLPDVSWDADENQYLFWKIDETADRVPKFDEDGMREQVLAAWQFVTARKLAQEHAEALAEEARKSGLSLADSIGKEKDIEVTRTGEFTWLKSDSALAAMQSGRQIPLGTVENVEAAGPDFMKAAYALKVSGIGVAKNHPEAIVYVMRLIETTPHKKVLMVSFETDPYYKYRAVATEEERKMLFRWIDNLEKEAELKWEERPDAREQR